MHIVSLLGWEKPASALYSSILISGTTISLFTSLFLLYGRKRGGNSKSKNSASLYRITPNY
jgi:hypothetical protein